MNPETLVPVAVPASLLRVKIFGAGSAGALMAGHVDFPGVTRAAVDTDPQGLAGLPDAEKILLESKKLRGLGTGGDPERGRELAEAHYAQLKTACADTDVVFLFCGLGGGAGTGMAPVLARAAREAGALVLAFVTLPFEAEGNRRQAQALAGVEQLRAAADGVISLPCQKVVGLIDPNASLVETFNSTTQILIEGARGVWRLLAHRGLIPLPFSDLCALLREQHGESWFAAVDAAGPERATLVIEKLFAHPVMDGGEVLGSAEAILLSLVGGPDLSLAVVNRVMEQVKQRNPKAQLMLGAIMDENFRDRLGLTLIATRRALPVTPATPIPAPAAAPIFPKRVETPAVESTAPALLPEMRETTASRVATGKNARARKQADRLRQVQLSLDIVSKSRFDKTEATIHNGEDLDVPTFIRRGVALN